MLLLRWIYVESIEVLAQSVESVVASAHTIGVQCWNDLEHEVLAQKTALVTPQISEYVKAAIQHMRPRRLSWVDSRCEDDHLLAGLEELWPRFRVIARIWIETLVVFLFGDAFVLAG